MKTNEAGLAIIKGFEGLRLKAYLCPAGKWTIGWGHTRGVRPGLVVSETEAERLLRLDVEDAEADVLKAIRGVPTTDNQFSALVSFTFNVGVGNLLTSSVLRYHRAGKYKLASAAFMWWVKGGRPKRTIPGLIRRRNAERKLYGAP